MSTSSRPRTHTTIQALWVGLCAGLVTGVVDAASSWSGLEQFLPTGPSRLRLIGHSGTLYASFGALVVLAFTLFTLAFRHGTQLGPLLRHALSTHRDRRARDPRLALTFLALAVAAVPAFGAALLASYRIGLATLAQRHHKGLIVAVLMALTLGLCAAALLATFALGALLERALARLLRGVEFSALAKDCLIKSNIGWVRTLAAG